MSYTNYMSFIHIQGAIYFYHFLKSSFGVIQYMEAKQKLDYSPTLFIHTLLRILKPITF
jgi:hypothetical protein